MNNQYKTWIVNTDELLSKVSANYENIPVMYFEDFVLLASRVVTMYNIKRDRALENVCDKMNNYLALPLGKKVLKQMGY